MEIEYINFPEVLKESIRNCKDIDDKFDKVIDIICAHMRMQDLIIDSLSEESRMKILNEAGLTEEFH